MGKFIEKRNGVNIYEYEAPKYRGKENINGVIADGMVLRLYQWLEDHDIDDYAIDELYGSYTSGIRNGNEIQVIDDIPFDYESDLYISYMYYYNGTVWAVLLDKANQTWYGEFEL